MEQSLTLILLYVLLPVSCLIIGGLISTSRLHEHTLGIGIQHCAAGVVFAAVAIELLPRVMNAMEPMSMIIGFVAGLVLMFGVKQLAEYLQRNAQSETEYGLPKTLLSSVSLDLFIDGLLISIAFLAGARGGILIALAIAAEELFYGMAISKNLEDKRVIYPNRILYNIVMSLLILLGAIAGFYGMQLLPESSTTFVLSFGMSALLYLVTEELLTEVHTKLETPWVTAMFFIGFLFILIVETTLW